MIRFNCNNCGEAYEVDEKYARKRTKCAKCEAPIQVPAPSSQEASTQYRTPKPPAVHPIKHRRNSEPRSTGEPRAQVTIDREQATGAQGFFRAFGITSGFMAAIAAAVVGIPVLACGGCLVSMIGIGATADVQKSLPNTSAPQEPPLSITSQAIDEGAREEEEVQNGATPTDVAVEPTTRSLAEVDISGRHGVHLFDGLIANVDDQYLSDVRIVNASGRAVTADVLLENSSGKSWKPNVQLQFVNKYGITLGRASVSWAITELAPYQRYSEKISYYPIRFESVFQYADLDEHDDFNTPKFLVVAYR